MFLHRAIVKQPHLNVRSIARCTWAFHHRRNGHEQEQVQWDRWAQHPILFLKPLLPHGASGRCASDPISTVAQNSPWSWCKQSLQKKKKKACLFTMLGSRSIFPIHIFYRHFQKWFKIQTIWSAIMPTLQSAQECVILWNSKWTTHPLAIQLLDSPWGVAN